MLIATACLLASGISTAPIAQAAVTCGVDEFGQAFVRLTEAGDAVVLRIDGTAIEYDAGSGSQQCDDATTTSTDTIWVDDTSSGNTRVTIDLGGGAFAPGFTNEPDASDEIEWSIDLGPGRADELRVVGAGNDDGLVFGSAGMNLNAAAELDATPDNDAVAFAGINRIYAFGGAGSDLVFGSGDLGTGGPLGASVYFFGAGGIGNDEVNGGAGDDSVGGAEDDDSVRGMGGEDFVDGGPGDDELEGNRGGDVLVGGADDDEISGGKGEDRASYMDADGPVDVSLAVEAFQDTGGAGVDGLENDIEGLSDGPYFDHLVGDAAANRLIAFGAELATGAGQEELVGGRGGDVLLGSSQGDVIVGGRGDDSVRAEGGADEVSGSSGDDSIRGGGGRDALFGNSGADTLRGQGARDFLNGGSNIFDRCLGGAGDDSFRRCEIFV